MNRRNAVRAMIGGALAVMLAPTKVLPRIASIAPEPALWDAAPLGLLDCMVSTSVHRISASTAPLWSAGAW